MDSYKADFIDFMVRSEVLCFGDFTAKSGRKTPYFINTGRYRSGSQMRRLARFYAETIHRSGIAFDLLFGPAYKGIPLAVAIAMALDEQHQMDVGFAFNRKEVKDHGEGGNFVGRTPQSGDRVLIVEDVTTAGTSIHESVPLLRACGDVQLAGLVVSVDRQERGNDERTALAELSAAYGMPCLSIVTVDDIIEYLHGRRIDGHVVLNDSLRKAMLDYRAQYGGKR
jgi:orotate phosphoribosyltransferase